MSNFLLAYGNQADAATLSTGLWNASFPQANLTDYRVSKKARTVDAAPDSTKVRFALASPAFIGVMGLMATNASPGAQYRMLLYSDETFAVATYDSGVVDLYPIGTMPFGYIPFGAPGWWGGIPQADELSRFQRNMTHVLGNFQVAQYGEIQVIDPANPDGFFQAGRLFVGTAFQPQISPEYGSASLQLITRTERGEARDGTPYFNTRKPSFTLPFALQWLTKNEGFRALDIQALVDIFGEVFVMWDPGDITFAFRRQVFGRLKQLDPVQFPRFATLATAFQVEGIVA